MRFGINTWAWALPVDESNLGAFLAWAQALDLPGERPVVEVFASPDPADLGSARAIGARLRDAGFGVVACGFNPFMAAPGVPNPHLVSPDAGERRAAVARATGFVEYAAAVAGDERPAVLSGPWHTRHMFFTGAGLSAAERDWLVAGLGEIAARAADRGVLAGFEVLNRFESYVLNTVAEAMEVIRAVGSPNLGMNWDSGHAHVDEPLDVVENARAATATGQTAAKAPALLAALREAGYRHAVVPELFCEALDGAVHKWIRREGDVTGAARRSIRFLRQCL
jgi:sugar phosphate isomerase/epimerase